MKLLWSIVFMGWLALAAAIWQGEGGGNGRSTLVVEAIDLGTSDTGPGVYSWAASRSAVAPLLLRATTEAEAWFTGTPLDVQRLSIAAATPYEEMVDELGDVFSVLLGYDNSSTRPGASSWAMPHIVYASNAEEVWSAISVHFPPTDQVWAYCVASPESSFNPRALGAAGEKGIMQVHWPSWEAYIASLGWVVEEEDLYKINTNIKVSSAILAKSGYYPWLAQKGVCW